MQLWFFDVLSFTNKRLQRGGKAGGSRILDIGTEPDPRSVGGLSPLEVELLPSLVEEWVALLLARVPLRLLNVLSPVEPPPLLLVRQDLVRL